MIRRQRLLRVGVEAGARDLARLQRLEQRGFIDDRAPCGVDQIGGRLHARDVVARHQPARACAEHDMNADDVGGCEQLVLGGITDAGLFAGLAGQIGAPGDDLHAECLADARDLPAEFAEADDAERLALDILAERDLPAFAGFHPRVLEADLAGQFQHQPDREPGRGIADRTGAADGDATRLGGCKVERGVAHARGQQQLEFRQRVQHIRVERRAFAHGADDLEILERRDGCRARCERLRENGDIYFFGERRPVRQREGHVLIVVKDCTAQPRHRISPLLRG